MWWFLFLLLIYIKISSISAIPTYDGFTKEQLDMMDRVMTCRAHCIEAFTNPAESINDLSCRMQADCFMCWENCEMFYKTFDVWGPICDEPALCFDGCKLACTVYRLELLSKPDNKNVWTFAQPIKMVKSPSLGEFELRWSPPVPLLPVELPIPRMIYALYWKMGSRPSYWFPLNYTVNTVFLTKNAELISDGVDFIIFAYTKDGNVAVTQFMQPIPDVDLRKRQQPLISFTAPKLPATDASSILQPSLIIYLFVSVIVSVCIFIVGGLVIKNICFGPQRWIFDTRNAIHFRRPNNERKLDGKAWMVNRARNRNKDQFASNAKLITVQRCTRTPFLQPRNHHYENYPGVPRSFASSTNYVDFPLPSAVPMPPALLLTISRSQECHF